MYAHKYVLATSCFECFRGTRAIESSLTFRLVCLGIRGIESLDISTFISRERRDGGGTLNIHTSHRHPLLKFQSHTGAVGEALADELALALADAELSVRGMMSG